MKKYWVLLICNFRKNRLQFFSFTAIIILSALFLNLGLSIALNFGKVYLQKWAAHKMADSSFVVYDMDYSKEAVDEIGDYPEVADIEVRDCSYLYGEFSVGDDVRVAMPMVVYNRDDRHAMNNYLLVESMPSDANNAAYVSYWFKTDKGCRLGDTLVYRTASATYEFTIAGFVEDLQYGNNNCGGIAIHMSQKCYEAFAKSAEPGLSAKAINIRTAEFDQGEAVYQKALQRMSGDWSFAYQYNSSHYEWNESARTLTTNIIAYEIVAFALAIAAISLLICGFRINNSIHEDMQNLGIQKSVGYRSGQIRVAVALPYIMICIISTALGIAASFAVLPPLDALIEKLTGLVWHQKADMESILITVGALLMAVVLTVALATRKVSKLQPVEALRSGIQHHNFKHNFIPLDKTRMSVTPALGMKNCLGSLTQNIVLCVIIASVTFLAMFAASAYYNMAMNTDNFLKVVSGEYSNVYVVTEGKADELAERLDGTDGIDRMLAYDEFKVLYKSRSISAFVCKDYSVVKNDLVYEGRNPRHDNEIVLGSGISEDVEIGDTVSIVYGGVSSDYLVVGFMQSPNQFGCSCELTDEGFKRIDSGYTPNTLNIYLNDQMTAEECARLVKQKAGDLALNIVNYDKTIETSMGTYISMTAALGGTISLVVVIILALVLLIIFSTIVVQKKNTFGILKAFGYTTNQLITQTILGIFPAIALGILIGCFAGNVWVNRVWLLAFSSLSIHKVNLSVPASGIIMVGALMLMISVLLSVLLCSRLRRISAVKLVRE